MSLQKTVLKINNLKKFYPIRRAFKAPLEVKALRGVSFDLAQGESLAIVGESGCGKSTLAKALMRIEAPTAGEIELAGKRIQDYSQQQLPEYLQMVFQDPYSSLNPRKKIKDIIAEPLKIKNEKTKIEIQKLVEKTATEVGLRPEILDRYPHMLSGGQRQRVGIARALVTEPKVLVCDEPVSALDVSVQAQVINLLLDLQKRLNVSLLFISHDLGVVRFISDRVLVMYLGQIVELGSTEHIFSKPKHPYTQLLLASSYSVETNDKSAVSISENNSSELPSPLNPPLGCGFHTRCPYASDRCRSESPTLKNYGDFMAACHEIADDGSLRFK